MHQTDHQIHAQSARAWLQDLEGDVDPTGLELLHLVKMTANLYSVAIGEQMRDAELSGPRWRLLLRLRVEELRGEHDGLSPTHLSRCQNVSKNTISALLRGLEEQKLVERVLNPADKRACRIHLTDTGREMIQQTAPQHLTYLNRLIANLTTGEQAELIGLLGQLHRSISEQVARRQAETSISGEN